MLELFQALYDYDLSYRMSEDEKSHNIAKFKKALHQYPSQINSPNGKGFTSLTKAIQMGNETYAKLLIQSGAEPTICNNEGYDAFCFAVLYGMIDLLKILFLKAPINVNKRYNIIRTNFDLHQLLFDGDNTISVSELRAFYVSTVQQVRSEQKTLLHLALEAEKNHIQLVSLLLNWGADQTLSDAYGKMPIDVLKDKMQCIEHLKDALVQTKEKIINSMVEKCDYVLEDVERNFITLLKSELENEFVKDYRFLANALLRLNGQKTEAILNMLEPPVHHDSKLPPVVIKKPKILSSKCCFFTLAAASVITATTVTIASESFRF